MTEGQLSGYVRRNALRFGLPLLAFLHLAFAILNRCGPDLIRPRDLLDPAMISATGVIVCGVIGLLITSDPAKAGLLGMVLALGFTTLGDAVEGLAGSNALEKMGGEPAVVLIYVIVCAALVRWLSRIRAPVTEWGEKCAVILCALIIFNAGQFALLVAERPADPVDPGVRLSGTAEKPPDIYLIVLDKYSGAKGLRENFGFDNTPFVSWLAAQGFIVPADQQTNYVHTFLVLSSLLNFQYLDDYPARFGARSTAWQRAYPDIENAKLIALLRRRGYRFVFMPSAFRGTRRNRYADLQVPQPSLVRNEYSSLWKRSTAMPVLGRTLCSLVGCAHVFEPYAPESAAIMDWKFSAISRMSGNQQPTFVLAHLLVPHEPLIYRADCRYVAPYWPGLDGPADSRRARDSYVEQVRCVNRRLEAVIVKLLGSSKEPPVILIQSDHGNGLAGLVVDSLRAERLDQVEDRLGVFAAYYLPGLPRDSIYPGITPVNVVRLVLRHYLGADLPPLPDRTYWSSTRHPYAFTLIRQNGAYLPDTANIQ